MAIFRSLIEKRNDNLTANFTEGNFRCTIIHESRFIKALQPGEFGLLLSLKLVSNNKLTIQVWLKE